MEEEMKFLFERVKKISFKKSLVNNNKGQGMVEYVLLLVVIIGLIIVFKKPITEKFNEATGKATSQMGEIIQ